MEGPLKPAGWIVERLRITHEGIPVLLGMECAECGEVMFPKSLLCYQCASEQVTERIFLNPKGKIWSFTIVYESYGNVIGLNLPYPVAFVELEEGVFVQTVLVGFENKLPEIWL